MAEFVVVCGAISTALAIFFGIPYIRSILHGQTKPHQFTMLIWMLMNGIVVVSQFLEGARASILIVAVFLLYSVINFGLSFRYGVRNSSRYDKLLLVLALVTMGVWILTQNNVLAIWLTIGIDVLATAMLILKLKQHPGSEPLWLWGIAVLAFVFSCLSLADKPFGILYVRPIYGVLGNLAVLTAIWYFRPARKRRTADAISSPQAEEY